MTVEGDEKAVRSRVFMDISIGGLPSGRLVFELFNDIAPKTAENFRALCAGDMGVGKNTGKPLTYKGMVFHRVVKDFMIQGGDFTNANGTGGESIYGGTFEDETFELKHDRPYLLSMANRGKDTNGSQFFITTQPAPHLDNVHVVFGTVIGGAALVRQLEALAVDRNARPLQDVTVTNCGQLVRVSAKKRKQEKEEKEESDADSDQSQKKDKKKKKDKKEKKKKRRHSSASGDEEETPEAPAHPLVSTSKIDPREIPDVPTNRFLMRGGRDQDDRSDPRKDRERMRYREREHRSYTRSGRIIKGRGVFRYRTPSRSRSRSRSVTPPHWRQAQRRIIKLSEFEVRAEQERSEKEQHDVTKRKEIEKIHSLVPFLGDAEGTTPDNHPDEKEEGECDSTLDRSQTDRVDYNALDFEEDIEHDDNDTSHKRKPVEKVDRRREMRRTPENRAEMLALALGVNPKHDQQSDAGSFSRDSRDSRESTRRREGLASTVGYASKLSSAVGNVSEGLAKGHHEEKSKDGYDPFSLLRSTFNRGGEKKDQGQQRKEGDRREAIKARLGEKEKDREDKRDRKTDREDKDRKQAEQKNDKEDRSRRHDNKEERTRKLPEIPEKEDRPRKNSEKEDRERKISERDDRRRHLEKNEKEERTRKHSERDERDRKHSEQRDHRRTDRHRSERSERREKSKERVRSEKSRDNDRSKARDDDKKRRRSRTPSPAKERSKSRDRRPSAAETREKSGERTPLDEEKKKVGQEDERNEARKELMEIVRLIKSRQRDRENKAAAVLAKKKRESSHSDSSDSDGDKRRRRSSDRDRRRRSNSRGRHSSSERRTRRRRSRSPRRDRRDRRRSSSSR
ncbi:peptidyl-prolyl cis-trans isomerase G isoform X1 [Spodoptera frugiperda]|uniref:peptidylprolyl isomerase n=1 Tax=Spodoptera frugiperda TaxID=7108 RepID=A0A9R0F5N1_SPOFR|nr:peptidyl-prolyl cis-trans isomerase G isoform X1 [Spodoptera frugiperda]